MVVLVDDGSIVGLSPFPEGAVWAVLWLMGVTGDIKMIQTRTRQWA